MPNKNLTLPLLSALLMTIGVAACNKAETPAETSADVATAQAEGARDVTEAQNKMVEEHNENVVDAVKGQEPMSKGDMKEDAGNLSKVEMERAEADYKVAMEQCDALTGDLKDACQKDAKLKLDTAKIAIEAANDITKKQINAQP